MDPMNIVRSVNGQDADFAITTDSGGEDRLKDVFAQTRQKRTQKNSWGGQSYPINVGDYVQYLGALTTISWILRDAGYNVQFMSQSGMLYDSREMVTHRHLYNPSGAKIVALVANREDDVYRISRDSKQLRLRKFKELSQAIGPMRDGNLSGTKPIQASTAKELVKFMKTRKELDPGSMDSVIEFSRFVRHSANRPRTAQVAKGRLRMEFRKHS